MRVDRQIRYKQEKRNSEEEIKRLNEKLRNMTKNQNRVMQNLNDKHQNNVRRTSLEHHKIKEKQNRELNSQLALESKKHQDKLENVRKNFVDTANRLNDEKANLVNNQKQNIIDKNLSFEHQINQQYTDTNNYIERLNNSSQNIIKNTKAENNFDINQYRLKAEKKLRENIFETQKKSTDKEFLIKQETQKEQYKAVADLAKTKIMHRRDLDELHSKNSHQMKELIKVNRKTLDNKRKTFNKLLVQEKTQFKQKMAKMRENHLKAKELIQQTFRNEIKDTIIKYSSEKDNTLRRIEDGFYHIETLDPKVTDLGKEYQITLKVPEHEKEHVQLNAYLRTMKVTAARRFADKAEDPTGVVNHTSRAEVYAKEFSVPEIIDPRSVVQKYEDGTLFFRIKKL